MGKIALEEHVLLNRENRIDRWRTLVPMIPEQFQQRLIAQLTDTSRRLEVMDKGEIDLAVLSSAAVVQGSLEPRAALRRIRRRVRTSFSARSSSSGWWEPCCSGKPAGATSTTGPTYCHCGADRRPGGGRRLFGPRPRPCSEWRSWR
jgi:hypothetical protein